MYNCRRLVEGVVPEGKASLKGSDLRCRVGHKEGACIIRGILRFALLEL